MVKSPKPILAVAFAEFDIDHGVTLKHKHPKKTTFGKYSDDDIAQLVLTDGAHRNKEDTTIFFLDIDGELVYGLGCFLNKSDASVRRGAIQAACLVFSRLPYFDTFEPLLKAAVVKFVNKEKEETLLKELFTALSGVDKNCINLWDMSVPITINNFKEGEFDCGKSNLLTNLVKRFRTDTLVLWYAMMREDRIVFSGQQAREIGESCLAVPLLISPIPTPPKRLFPSPLPLTFLASLTDATLVLGCNHPIVQEQSQAQVVASSASSVYVVEHKQGLRITGKDKQFIKGVLNGIDERKSEKWVRDQFRRFTQDFVDSLVSNRLAGHQLKYLGYSFAKTSRYAKYVEWQQSAGPSSASQAKSPLQLLAEIKKNETKEKTLMALSMLPASMQNIADTEQVLDTDCVEVIAPFLTSESGQWRKFAVSTLAALSLVVKGQVKIVSAGLLPRIVLMVQDKKEGLNVRSAACECLKKISTLFTGAKALVGEGAIEPLQAIVCDPDLNELTFKSHAAGTLLHLNRRLPVSPSNQVKEDFKEQLKITDKAYNDLIVEILDIWEVDVRPLVAPSPPVRALAKQLAATSLESSSLPDMDDRFAAAQELLVGLTQRQFAPLDLVANDTMATLWENLTLPSKACDGQPTDSPTLVQLSWDLLTLLADTYTGALYIQEHNCIELTLQGLVKMGSEQLVYRQLRFLEVCCQRRSLGREFMGCGGIARFVTMCDNHFEKETRLLCIPILSTFRYLIRLQPAHYNELRRQIAPLCRLARPPAREDIRGIELYKLLAAVLCMASVYPDAVTPEVLQEEMYQTIVRRGKTLGIKSSRLL